MTERDELARIIREAGVDLSEDGVGDHEINAERIAETVVVAEIGRAHV